MRKLIRFPLEDGTFVVAEIDEPEQLGIRDVKRDQILTSSMTLEAAFDKVKPAVSAILQKVRSMATNIAIDEIELGFGIKLNAEVGAIFAVTGLEANYTVTLHWRPEREENRTS